jgi:hypothetical protein
LSGAGVGGGVLRFVATHDVDDAGGARLVVADLRWTGRAGERAIPLRDTAARLFATNDFLAESMAVLDTWADGADVTRAMELDGTSYWFRERLGMLRWLEQLDVWLAIVDDLVRALPPNRIEVDDGIDEGLARAARLVAARDGIDYAGPRPDEPAPVSAEPAGPAMSASARGGPGPSTAAAPARRISILGRIRRRVRPDEMTRRAQMVWRRIGALGARHARPVAVLEAAAPQRIDTAAGPRQMNAFLGPVVDRLRGTRLDPVEIDLLTAHRDDAGWKRLNERGAERVLPGDALRLYFEPADVALVADDVDAVIARLRAVREPALLRGVDVGPELAGRVADRAAGVLPGMLRRRMQIQRLLRELAPACLLLADEYHRQDWVGAAASLGVPTAAIQHGIIHAGHGGYMYQARAAGMGLPTRTYVFGRWERDLLVERSVYRPDEVVVSGSPRLSLVRMPAASDRAAVRAELGIADGDRLLVVSGTWGALDRTFAYPIALAAIMDRPLPGVHVVVKLHPGESDEGPYRAVIEGAAAARGLLPPPITVIQEVDLYRLLAASDAHLGIHSTVMTEAVAAGTLNLLAATVAGADQLDYVRAGVAVPIRDGGDLLDALARRDELLPDEATRRAFAELHFEPGDAPSRIADDLLGWLA